MNKISFLLLAVFISGCASQKAPRLWEASSIADYPNSIVLFTSKPKGKVISGVYTADVRNLIQIKEQIENAAGPLRVKLLIEESGDPNGFSFIMHEQPLIAINAAMINLLGQDSDAVAALFGHELAHLYLEHGNLRKDREEKRVFSSLALSFTLGMVGIPAPVELTDVATTAVSNTYSREDEREADQFGVFFMVNAGFDPWGAVRLQEKLNLATKKSSPSFLSTHPNNEERIANMKQLAQNYGKTGDKPPSK